MRISKSVCAVALLFLISSLAKIPECAAADTQQSFKFIVMGDNRPDSAEGPQPLVFHKIIDEINALYFDADTFVVGTGDFILGTDTRSRDEVERQFNDFNRAIKRLKIRFYPVPGNHDVQYPDLYQEFLGKMYYSFDHKGSHFIIIN